MTKVKLFFGGEYPMDDKINKFLSGGNREYVDLKLIGVNNTSMTQCSYMSVLVYKENK